MRGCPRPGARHWLTGLLLVCATSAWAGETEPAPVSGPQPLSEVSKTGDVDAPGADPEELLLALDASNPDLHASQPTPLAESDPLLAEFDDDFALDLSRAGVADPLEGLNRRVFAFNQLLDALAWEPMTRGYQLVVPGAVRRGIHRVFENLESPVIFTNQLLQLRLVEAATTAGRFALNSTAGAGGFFDPAARGAGWERLEADFGQTLARYGMPSGPYLVVPLFGPSTARDLGGDLVDRLLDPLTYVIGPIHWWILLGTSQGLSEREVHSEELHALQAVSIDFYSALRSAYFQSRQSEVRRAREGDPSDPGSASPF